MKDFKGFFFGLLRELLAMVIVFGGIALGAWSLIYVCGDCMK